MRTHSAPFIPSTVFCLLYSLSLKESALILMHLLADAAGPATNVSITTAPSAPPTSQPAHEAPFPFNSPIIIPLILMGVFLIFSTRTKRKAEKKVQDMLGNLK